MTDIHYVVRRQTKSDETAMTAVTRLLALMEICPVDRGVLQQAIALRLSDFEDAVQVACAIALGLDAIVTRDRIRKTFGSVFFQEVKMKTKGKIIWDYKQGWNSPELEVPSRGKIAVFIDYPDDDLTMPIIEPEVEELLSDLGYFGEGRYIGENDCIKPFETKTVTYVDTFPMEELSDHLRILNKTIIPKEWFYILNSEGNIINIDKAIVPA